VQIIRPRVEEILEMVRDRLAASPFAAEPRGTVVLSGGACQLTGLPELAARILGRQVRIGRPLGISGLPEAAKGPAFAVTAGLPGLSAGGPSRTFRTAANAANDDRNGRLHRAGRQMAEGELLMIRNRHPRNGRWRTGRSGGIHPARVFMRQP
jgi:cell division protein FtsA